MKRFLDAIRAVFADDRMDVQRRREENEPLRKAGIRMLVCLAVLLIGFAVCMMVHGNYISLYYRTGYKTFSDEHGYGMAGEPLDLTENDLDIVFEPDGIAVLKGMSVMNGVARFDIAQAGTGEVTCSVKVGDTIYTEYLTGGKLCIYRPGRLVFPGWQAAMVAGSLYCCFAALILFLEYRRLIGEKLFSYTSIYMLGLTVFFSVVAFGTLILLIMLILDPTAYDFGKILEWSRLMMLYFTGLTAPGIAVFSIALCISNIQLIRKEGFRTVNLLGIILSVVLVIGMFGGVIVYDFLIADYQMSYVSLSIYYSIYSFMVCLLIGVFVIFGRVRRHEPAFDKGYIIILGCKIKDDGSLYPLIRGRVDRALEFARKQEEAGGPSPIFIPSGGKGDDEPMSEADAMAEYMISQGIARERIFPESSSVRTKENMRFSKDIADLQCPGAEGAFSTTNYHVFRSGVIANSEGMDIDGMGAPTKWYFWPNALIREFIGLLVDDVKEVAAVMLLIAIISASASMIL